MQAASNLGNSEIPKYVVNALELRSGNLRQAYKGERNAAPFPDAPRLESVANR